ncbi:hypothetical protein AAF712_007220 [Marasmius tenuissimus]|uniref:Carboxylesterase type B domain-containing protein n=1 Tax=Marasmius tenuissimus TaxID=585030 RepID=A0ABR2ZXE8_9AGAR
MRETDTSALELANENITVAGFFGTFTFVPVVDGTFIRQRPTQALREGKLNGEALLVVHNTDEGEHFVNQTAPPFNASQYVTELFPKLTPQEAAKVAELYAGLGSDLIQENLIMGESIIICPTYFFANAFSNRTYMGEFAIPPPFHGQDLSYYWPSFLTSPENPLPRLGRFNNTNFIDAFAQSFISFAISLNPNVKVDPSTITPQWDLYDLANNKMMFNKTVDDLPDIRLVGTSEDFLERCSFWESVGARTGQ